MNWMKSLLDTYETCVRDMRFVEDPVPLLPIFHTSSKVQIEITLDIDGNFLNADLVPKNDQTTIMPCTEKSGGRSGIAPAPHPLADKLQYLIADCSKYAPKDLKCAESSYQEYISQLESWCSSHFQNEKVCAVLRYIKSGTILNDLVRSKIITMDNECRILSKSACSSLQPQPDLYSISKLPGEQLSAFVRWRVDKQGDVVKNTWKDPEIQNSWINYYINTLSDTSDCGLCYVSGNNEVLAQIHPKFIRNPGDQAKIISSNDSKNGFVFRGRFETAEQACGVGIETSQKAHNALRWLIGRQGYREGDLCIVSWTVSGSDVMSPVNEYYEIYEFDMPAEVTTGFDAAEHLNKRIRGYNSEILNENVMIMAMTSATPGRISILMYRETLGKDFVERLEKWHNSCAWKHRYAYKESEDSKRHKYTFIGAPTPKDMAKAAYGEKADNKIIVHAIQRILPCILDGKKIPKDITDSAVRRACNPASMEEWEWQKTLSIACSMYKQYSGVDYSMVLDTSRTTRDYLYGRLLAMADLLEGKALEIANEERKTTAIRLMQRFSEFPYSTWRNIELALVPYITRLGPKSKYYEIKIAEIMDLFEPDDFIKDTKLSGEFLLAYHTQKEDHFRKREVIENKKNEEE